MVPRDETILFSTRRHGVVLLGAFVRVFAVAAIAVALVAVGWPWSAGAAPLLALAALAAVASVWRWERTLLLVTPDKLVLVRGTLRKRTAAVRLDRVGTLELEQTLPGRLFGYGTLVAGELEVTHLPAPRELYRRVERIAA